MGLLKSLSLGKLRRIRNAELEAECKSICRLAAEHDLTVAWLWCKRDEPIIQVRPALSTQSRVAVPGRDVRLLTAVYISFAQRQPWGQHRVACHMHGTRGRPVRWAQVWMRSGWPAGGRFPQPEEP